MSAPRLRLFDFMAALKASLKTSGSRGAPKAARKSGKTRNRA
jgi:hypothetical protein